MIQEIYTIGPEADNYVEGQIETTDAVQTILERIKIILGTRPGEVIGDPNFGINLEDYLFDINVDTDKIKKEIGDQITSYIGNTSPYSVGIDVNFGKASSEFYDYMLIDIYINQEKTLGVIVGI